MMKYPMIVNLPTDEEIELIVDKIILPEAADRESALVCGLIMAIADPDGDRVKWGLAETAMKRAFQKTTAYDTAFRQFAGLMPPENQRVDPDLLELAKTQ